MYSQSDSEATYCSEVENLIKVSSAIKSFAPQMTAQPLRRSQRILEKLKQEAIDVNYINSCTDKGNNSFKQTTFQIKASQNIISMKDLREVYQTLVCEPNGIPMDEKLKPQLDVPLDLSKKSKVSIKETSKEGIHDPLTSIKEESYVLENKISKESKIPDLKLKPTQEINQIDRNINTLRKPFQKINKHKKRSCKNLKREDKNIGKVVKSNCMPPLKEFKEHKISPPSKTTKTNEARITDLQNTIPSYPLRTESTITTSKPITDELQTRKDFNLKSNDIYPSTNSRSRQNLKEFNFSKNYKHSDKSEHQISLKFNDNTLTKDNYGSGHKRTMISNENLSAKLVKIDELKAEMPLTLAKRKKSFGKNFCGKTSHKTSNTSTKMIKDFEKITKINKKSKRHPILNTKMKSFKKATWPNKNIDGNKKKNLEKLHSLKASGETHRKTQLQINSEEILSKTKNCGKSKLSRRLSLQEDATKPLKQVQRKPKLLEVFKPLRRPLPSTKFFKEYATSQNLLTPTQSTQDLMTKFMQSDDCPPHFKYQLRADTRLNRPTLPQPTCVITPDNTPSVELLDSLSSSPSLPESLCELLQTKDIKALLNVDKVAYRLYDYHIQPLALILNQSQEYLRKVLDKVVNITPNVLKNANKAVEEPFVKDKDLFANSSDEYLTSEEIVFNT